MESKIRLATKKSMLDAERLSKDFKSYGSSGRIVSGLSIDCIREKNDTSGCVHIYLVFVGTYTAKFELCTVLQILLNDKEEQKKVFIHACECIDFFSDILNDLAC